MQSSSRGTIFQRSCFIESVKRAFQRPAQILSVCRRDSILGGIVLYPGQKMGVRYTSAPFYIPYNGFLLAEFPETSYYFRRIKQQQQVLEILQNEIKKEYAFSIINQHRPPEDLRSLIWNDWDIQPRYTVEAALDGAENMFGRVERNQRRRIRNFEDAGLTFSEFDDAGQLYALVKKSYAMHATHPPLPAGTFTAFTDELLKRGIGRCFAVKDGETVLSAVFVVEDSPNLFALFSGREPHGETSSSELFLLWKMMCHYSSKGFQTVDLLGAMIPSITKIKLDLGGRLVRYDRFQYHRNGLIRFLFKIESARKSARRRQ